MFGGFGVGFGVGEFGSAGYAVEVDDSAVTMVASAELGAFATEISSDTSLVAMVAASSLSINPGGITVSEKPRSVTFTTAPPPTVQELRTVPTTTTRTTFTIKQQRKPDYDGE